MTKILIADDNTQNLYLLETVLKSRGYEVVSARNGAQAFELATSNPPDVIITDILMPVMDGFELCRRWKAHELLNQVPLIFYTATYTDFKDEQFALSLGADRFITKPQEPEVLIQMMQEVLSKPHKTSQVSREKSQESETKVLEQYNEVLFRKLEKKVAQLESVIAKQKKTLNDAVSTMSKIVEMRDPYTSGHQNRVAKLATAIAKEIGFRDDEIEQLYMAAVIHDIGKIYVPSDILNRPGKLNELEFNLIKTHAQDGYEIVKNMEFLPSVSLSILQHHERMNGSGYPKGLKGESISQEARIIAVADVVEAMSSDRPYRSALGIDKALDEISHNRGMLYSPDAVDACLKLFKEMGFKFE